MRLFWTPEKKLRQFKWLVDSILNASDLLLGSRNQQIYQRLNSMQKHVEIETDLQSAYQRAG